MKDWIEKCRSFDCAQGDICERKALRRCVLFALVPTLSAYFFAHHRIGYPAGLRGRPAEVGERPNGIGCGVVAAQIGNDNLFF